MRDNHAAKLTARYNREARDYLELWGPVLKTAGLRLLDKFEHTKVHRVVDVGAGVGLLLPEIQRVFRKALVLGLDRSHGMLSLAPPQFSRTVCDAGQMALRSGSFDLVLMVFMLFHLENPLGGLREARRIAREKGRVGTLTWGGEFESEAERIWTACLDSYGAPVPDTSAQSCHEPVNSPEKLEALFHEAGFHSARAWSEELAYPIGLEHLILLKTRVGSQKPRFDELGDKEQIACISKAKSLMAPLGPEDFISKGEVIYGIAETG